MPAPPAANALGQRALRIQFDFDFLLQRELLESFVFADVAGDHFLDLLVLQQQADAVIVDARRCSRRP